jgi:hypothetical protein
MSKTNTITTLRQKVADSIPKYAVEAERQSHDLYYYKLLVYRNGSLSWSQFVTASEGTGIGSSRNVDGGQFSA